MVLSTGALLINAFDVRERGKAMGMYSGVSMVFLALGPLVGGVLTISHKARATTPRSAAPTSGEPGP